MRIIKLKHKTANYAKPINIQNIINEAKKYQSVDEFEARGFEVIQKELFGVNTGDIVHVPLENIVIKWKDDLENAEYMPRQQNIDDTTEPVDFIFNIKTEKYTLDDGHNRYVAARRQGRPLKGIIEHTEGNLKELASILRSKTGYSSSQIFNIAHSS